MQFNDDNVNQVIKNAIGMVLGRQDYQSDQVNIWSGQVVNYCVDELSRNQTTFKYIVTAMIMQKRGAGLHTASASYWDNDTDGSCTVRWENCTMYCIVSVYGLAV